jgi:hypothetical protein
MDEDRLRGTLARLGPEVQSTLRRLLIAEPQRRDRVAQELLRSRTESADTVADLIDMLTMNADARRQIVRILSELEASG